MAAHSSTPRYWTRSIPLGLVLLLATLIALPLRAALLNDTGIDWCANADTNFLACSVSGYLGQDGDYGRDVDDYDDSDGHAGFSFTKLDAAGQALPADAADWTCVRDNVTGLVWEVKTDDGGLRDKDNTYTWDASFNYARDVNAQGLCGFNDWRVPAIKELAGITHLGRTNPTIDTAYFPNTISSWLWSASPGASDSYGAWGVNFYGGYVHHLRLR